MGTKKISNIYSAFTVNYRADNFIKLRINNRISFYFATHIWYAVINHTLPGTVFGTQVYRRKAIISAKLASAGVLMALNCTRKDQSLYHCTGNYRCF